MRRLPFKMACGEFAMVALGFGFGAGVGAELLRSALQTDLPGKLAHDLECAFGVDMVLTL